MLHGHMDKTYYAVCQGTLEGDGTIDAPIRRRENAGIRREVGDGGQRSVTHWKALCSCDGMTLLEIALETGRTHQIRVHMKYIGHPLPGDFLYHPDYRYIKRQALHSAYLRFTHPVTKEIMEFEQMPDF